MSAIDSSPLLDASGPSSSAVPSSSSGPSYSLQSSNADGFKSGEVPEEVELKAEEAENDVSEPARAARSLMAYRASLGELCATFVLVYAACGSGIAVSQRMGSMDTTGLDGAEVRAALMFSTLGGLLGSILGSLTVALIAMALIYSFASISGCHMNPAVTVALWSSNRTSARKATMYIVAQLIGANLAMLALFFTFNFDANIFQAAAVIPAADANVFSVFFTEFALTFILVFIILKVAFEDVEEEKKKTMSYKAVGGARGLTIYAPNSSSKLGFAPLAIGTTIGVLGTLGSSVSGGCYNPARYIAPALWSRNIDGYVFAYILGELLGGCAAALMRHSFDVLGRMAHAQEDKAAELRQSRRSQHNVA